jgi:hypothetical protein
LIVDPFHWVAGVVTGLVVRVKQSLSKCMFHSTGPGSTLKQLLECSLTASLCFVLAMHVRMHPHTLAGVQPPSQYGHRLVLCALAWCAAVMLCLLKHTLSTYRFLTCSFFDVVHTLVVLSDCCNAGIALLCSCFAEQGERLAGQCSLPTRAGNAKLVVLLCHCLAVQLQYNAAAHIAVGKPWACGSGCLPHCVHTLCAWLLLLINQFWGRAGAECSGPPLWWICDGLGLLCWSRAVGINVLLLLALMQRTAQL